MRIRLVLAALSVAVAVSSCGPVKYSSSENLNLKSVQEYAFIEPVADVLYYDRKNKPVYDADLSEEAADLITTIVSSQRYPFSSVIHMDYDRKNKPVYDADLSEEAADLITSIVSSQRYPFSGVIRMDYDRSDRDIRKWIQNIGSVSTSRLSRVRVPGDLLDAIDRSGHRYGVIIFSSGFIRSREAIRYEETQEAIGNVLGAVLDAIINKKDKDDEKKKSTYEPYSNPENKTPYDCNMYCVVIDTESDEIVHYIHPVPFLEKDPLNGSDMETMLNRLLKEFWE